MDFDNAALPYPTRDPGSLALRHFTTWMVHVAATKGLGGFNLETWIDQHYGSLEQAFPLPNLPDGISLRQAWLANMCHLIFVERVRGGMSDEQLLSPNVPFSILSVPLTAECATTLHTAAIAWAAGESGIMPHTHQAARAITVGAADSLSRVVGVAATVGRRFTDAIGEIDARYTTERWQANIWHLADIYTAPPPHTRKRRSHS